MYIRGFLPYYMSNYPTIDQQILAKQSKIPIHYCTDRDTLIAIIS